MTQFRRSGQRDGRRRRVMIDENVMSARGPVSRSPATDGAAGVDRDAPPAARTYAPAALPERQPRVTDLIPVRWWKVSLLFVGGLMTIGAIELLYAHMGAWAGAIGAENLSALDPAARGSLAAWFSSVLLGAAAIAAVLVYTIRRHKMDDYRGRYRIWVWVAVFWIIAGIDAVTGLHDVIRGGLVRLTGTTLYADGSIWWVTVDAVVFGSLGVGVLLDVRQSRSAGAALIATALAYVVAAIGRLGLLPLDDELRAVMVYSGAAMLGHLLLLASTGLYARYVCLDAQGLVPARRKRAAGGSRGFRQASPLSDGRPEAVAGTAVSAAGRKAAAGALHDGVAKCRDTDLEPQLAVTSKSAVAAETDPLKETSMETEPDSRASAIRSQLANEAIRLGLDPQEYAGLSKSQRRRLRKQHRRRKKAG